MSEIEIRIRDNANYDFTDLRIVKKYGKKGFTGFSSITFLTKDELEMLAKLL